MLKKAQPKETRGRKPIGKKNKAVQIAGPYFTPEQIKLLGGKVFVKASIDQHAEALKKSIARETIL